MIQLAKAKNDVGWPVPSSGLLEAPEVVHLHRMARGQFKVFVGQEEEGFLGQVHITKRLL